MGLAKRLWKWSGSLKCSKAFHLRGEIEAKRLGPLLCLQPLTKTCGSTHTLYSPQKRRAALHQENQGEEQSLPVIVSDTGLLRFPGG
jgi:hypothetical protein